jgi:cytochrome P450
MSATIKLDRERLRDLFDLRRRGEHGRDAAVYRDDPYPAFRRLRESGPVHEGTLHGLLGWERSMGWASDTDRRQFTVFDFETCDRAFRDEAMFLSAPEPVDPNAGGGLGSSMLRMNGPQHRRYRALVQPSFVPKKAEWWISQWIRTTVHALIDGFEADGKAELNVDFDAAIPVLTITGSFGLPVEDALTIRANLGLGYGRDLDVLSSYLMPVIAARRDDPQDDLISVLCQAEIADEQGNRHRLTDAEIFSFSHLLLAAGSGTTWKQIGITLAALLDRPNLLAAVRDDRTLLRATIEESLRWCPNDPVFSRYTAADVELGGTEIPAGSIVQVCLGSANRDPKRWDRADEFDIDRALLPSLGFGGGAHVCIGQHVARAEMFTAIDALLSRLPNLRLDPAAPPPQIIGLYERGPTELNVLWG